MLNKLLLFIFSSLNIIVFAQIAPIANNDNINTDEDNFVLINVLANDTDDVQIDTSSVTVITVSVLWGSTTSINSSGEMLYTPAPNYNGTDTIVYSICDIGTPVLCDTANVFINVLPVQDTPVLVTLPVSVIISEDTTLTMCTSATDGDFTTPFVGLGGVWNGTIVGPDAFGCFVYTPNPNYNGTDSVCLIAWDTNGNYDTACIFVEVTSVNDEPIAVDDYQTVNEGNNVLIDILANDSDAESTLDSSSISIITLASFVTASINSFGEILYTPYQEYCGSDTIVYSICDNDTIQVLCDTANVFIDVVCVQDTPVLVVITAPTPAIIPEDSTMILCATATDADGTTPFLYIGGVWNGTVVGPDMSGCFEYTPNPNYNGTDSVCLIAWDTIGNYDTVCTFVEVTSVNDEPIIILSPNLINPIPENSSVTICTSVTDIEDLSALTVSALNPNNGILTGPDITGCFEYTPNTNYTGYDSLCFFSCDFDGACDTICSSILMYNVNALIANNDFANVVEDNSVIINVLANDSSDIGIDTSSVSTISVLFGNTTINSFGEIIYTPNTNYCGFDTIVYSVCNTDIPTVCLPANVIVNIACINDTPTIIVDTVEVIEYTTISICPIISDIDNLTSDLVVSVCNSTTLQAGTLVVVGQCIEYTPANNYLGFDTFCAIVCDPSGLCDTVEGYIEVVDSSFNVFQNSFSASCSSVANSYIHTYTTGGSGLFTYLWDDGSDNAYLIDPTQGIHTCLVTDITFGNSHSISTYFSLNCFNLSGNIYIDINGNCIVDTNDLDYLNQMVQLRDTVTNFLYSSITDAFGNYSFDVNEGAYEIIIPSSSYFISCPSNPIVVLDSLNSIDTLDIYVTQINSNDLSINTYLNLLRPGFGVGSSINYYNSGSVNETVTIVLNYDSLLVPSSYNTGVIDTPNRTITWSYSLNAGYISYIIPSFNALGVTVPLGTNICNTVTISPTIGDASPLNNIYTYCRTVVGSYDPNYKGVNPNGAIEPEIKTHRYHIDFQNLGTYEATFVIVKDDLDDNLDINTLRDISTSHNFVVNIENEDELVFTFDNIHLAAKQDDEEGSKGHIDFTIDQKENLPLGTEIENIAEIYFDFNEAIITNTAYNIIEKTINIEDLQNDNSISIYPNPTNGLLNLVSEDKINNIQVFNSIGKIVFEKYNIDKTKTLVDLSIIPNGIYTLFITTKKGMSSHIVLISSK